MHFAQHVPQALIHTLGLLCSLHLTPHPDLQSTGGAGAPFGGVGATIGGEGANNGGAGATTGGEGACNGGAEGPSLGASCTTLLWTAMLLCSWKHQNSKQLNNTQHISKIKLKNS